MERGIFMPVSTTEKILSEDYFDLIVPITGSDTDFEEAFFRFGAQAAVPGYGIIHINRQFLPDNILNVIGYSNIPKLYTLMDTSALESSGILKVQTQPLLGYQGEGVLIGFLDTGIDFTHPAFRTSDEEAGFIACGIRQSKVEQLRMDFSTDRSIQTKI